MAKVNKKFYLSLDFWVCLIVFVTSVSAAVHVDLDSVNWYVETVFSLLGLAGMFYTLFFKKRSDYK